MRIDKLTTKFQQALSDAQSLAVGHDHPSIEAVHVLSALLGQEDGEEDHAFRERGEDDRLVADGAGSAGVAPGRLGGLHADDAHANGRPEGRQTDMQATGQFCQHGHHTICLSFFSSRPGSLATVRRSKFVNGVPRVPRHDPRHDHGPRTSAP